MDSQETSRSDTSPDGNPLIEIADVTKIYQSDDETESVTALQSIDLDIAEAEFVSLVGPSGCGKTTLLRSISGLTPITEGSIKLRGTAVEGPVSDVGFVFQSSVLMDWRTVMENVMFPFEAMQSSGQLDRSKEYYRERANDLLDLVGLEDFKESYPRQLSGGMQQRVAISRALLPDPPVLLMDEPFGSLDAFTRDRLNSELLDIWQETQKTIVFVTHNVSEAVFLSDRIVVLSPRPGRISAIYDIDIERPRSLDDRDTDEFNDLEAEVRGDIEVYDEGVRT